MSAVFFRELRAFWGSRKGWITTAALLFFNGLFMMTSHFYFGSTRYEIILGTMTLVIACLLPVWTVSRFTKDPQNDRDRFLRMLPISPMEIFVGKILAALVIMGIYFLILSLFPIVLSFFGGKSFLSAYISLAGAFLMGCALLSGLTFLALLLRKRVVAWIVSYLWVAVLYVLARLARSFPDAIEAPVRYLSLFGSFNPYSCGVLDWRTMIWYASVALLFFAASCILLGKREDGVFISRGIVAGILSVLLMSSTVVSAFLPAYLCQLDMTVEKSMSVSDSTKSFLKALDEDVTVYLLDDETAEAEGNGYEDERFEYFLNRYESYSDHLTVERIPISESGSLLAEIGLTTDQVYQYCMVIKSAKRTEVLDYMSLLNYTHKNSSLYSLGLPYEFGYSNYSYYASVFDSMIAQDSATYSDYYYAFYNDVKLYFKGEQYLNAVVEYVTADLIPTKYLLTGHGESAMTDLALGGLITDYKILDLTTCAAVPADASALILLAPDTDYTPAEIQMLTDYLNRGGTLTVVTGNRHLTFPNLMGLLNQFGMSAEAGTVQENRTETVKQDDGTETSKTVRSDSVSIKLNLNHDVLAQMDELGEEAGTFLVKGGNSIHFHTTEDSSLITTALLTTSDQAMIGDTSEEKASHILAAAAETNCGARLVWFTGEESFLATTEAVKEDLTKLYGVFCPYLAAEWSELTYTSELTAVSPVLYEEAYLQATDLNMIAFGVIACMLLPALTVTVGLIIVYKRKKA